MSNPAEGACRAESIPAIPTRYKGYRMRSRLEARWAVVFDAMGLKWTYEPEGFLLSTGAYLPDFYIETWGIYVEVKPRVALDRAVETARAFGHEQGAILFIFGSPGRSDVDYNCWLFCHHSGGRPAALRVEFCMFGEDRPQLLGESGYVDSYYTFSDRTKEIACLFFPNEPDEYLIEDAMNAGRAARFEHGEHGEIR